MRWLLKDVIAQAVLVGHSCLHAFLQLSGPLLRICDPAPWLLEEFDARFAVNASTLRGVLQVGSGKERLGGRHTIKMVDDQDVVRIVGLRCTDSLVTPPSFCMSATES